MGKFKFLGILLFCLIGHITKAQVGIRDTTPDATLDILNIINNDAFRVDDNGVDNDPTPFIIKADGKVGIGTETPAEKLEVNGNIRMTDGNQADGKLMVSDVDGTSSWVRLQDLFTETDLSTYTASNPINLTWDVINLSSLGVPANAIVNLIVFNQGSKVKTSGARMVGSTLNRSMITPGRGLINLQVKTNANSEIEVFQTDDEVLFIVSGYYK